MIPMQFELIEPYLPFITYLHGAAKLTPVQSPFQAHQIPHHPSTIVLRGVVGDKYFIRRGIVRRVVKVPMPPQESPCGIPKQTKGMDVDISKSPSRTCSQAGANSPKVVLFVSEDVVQTRNKFRIRVLVKFCVDVLINPAPLQVLKTDGMKKPY